MRHLSSTTRAVLAVVLLISAGSVLAMGARRYAERQRTTTQINRLRDDLYRARVASDRCRSILATSESSLQTLSVTIDSLRSVVADLEALGDGRVPAGRYDEYPEIFDSYNDSVAVWEIRSERLLTAEASCRTAIERHNAVSDTIQAVLRQAGIEAD